MATGDQNACQSDTALRRLRYVSEVHAQMDRGMGASTAVRLVVERATVLEERHVPSERTVRRWLKRYREGGLAGLSNQERARTDTSVVLPRAVVEFLREQKQEDPAVSSPELIRRAVEEELIADVSEVNRSAIWRASKRMDLPTRRRPTKNEGDCRRFAYDERMMMMMADGKHFRAGIKRLKRVAIFYLDDCTRFVLHVAVGTAESTELFLRGLYEMILKYGTTNIVYLDLGSGFKSNDTRRVIASIDGMHLILGTKATRRVVRRSSASIAPAKSECWLALTERRMWILPSSLWSCGFVSLSTNTMTPCMKPWTSARPGRPFVIACDRCAFRTARRSFESTSSSPSSARSPTTTSSSTQERSTRSRWGYGVRKSRCTGTCSMSGCRSSTAKSASFSR